MPIQITITFEPTKNIAYFDIDTVAMLNAEAVSYPLSRAFKRLDGDELNNFFKLGIKLSKTRVTESMSDWRHVARSIAHQLRAGYLWDLSPEDCTIQWKDTQGFFYEEPNAIPDVSDIVHTLGTTIISDFLRVGDPCYAWRDSKDTQVPVLPGEWTFEVTLRDDNKNGMGTGHRPARLVAYNAEAGPLNIETLLTGFNPHAYCSVDSATCGFMFDEPMPSSTIEKNKWFNAVMAPILNDDTRTNASFKPELHAVIPATFLGDGSYPMFVQYNEQGQAIAVALVTDYGDPLMKQNHHMKRDFKDEQDVDTLKL